MWKFFAWISACDKIFHETLSMKAPSVLSGFWPAGQSTARSELAICPALVFR